jgi:hypothetical protein
MVLPARWMSTAIVPPGVRRVSLVCFPRVVGRLAGTMKQCPRKNCLRNLGLFLHLTTGLRARRAAD